MSTAKRRDLFLSYSSKDRAFARDIRNALQDGGVKVWFDEGDIPLGGSIPIEIQKGLEASDQLLVLISENSLKSKWVETEWTKKFGQEVSKGQITVIPLILGNITEDEIPFLLRDKLYVRITDDCTEAVKRILADIKRRQREEFEKSFTDDKDFLKRIAQAGSTGVDRSMKGQASSQCARRIIEKIDRLKISEPKTALRQIQMEIEFAYEQIKKQLDDLKNRHDDKPGGMESLLLLMAIGQSGDIERLRDKVDFLIRRTGSPEEMFEDVMYEVRWFASQSGDADEEANKAVNLSGGSGGL